LEKSWYVAVRVERHLPFFNSSFTCVLVLDLGMGTAWRMGLVGRVRAGKGTYVEWNWIDSIFMKY
jgi:hypothetical protein